MEDFFQNAELTTLVARRLDHAAMANCIRVCKLWYKAFIPPLWRTFGTSPPPTKLFGIPNAPEVSIDDVTFPLQIPDPDHPESTETIPVLAHANPDCYPSYLPDDPVNYAGDGFPLWERFFASDKLEPSEEDLVRTTLAKYGHHIRYLTVRTLRPFRCLEHICIHLRGLHFCLEWIEVMGEWERDMSKEERNKVSRRIQRDVEAFIQRQSNLDSIYIYDRFFNTPGIRRIVRSNRARWKHVDMLMAVDLEDSERDKNYLNMATLWPNLQSFNLAIACSAAISLPLQQPHIQMRELQLWVNDFSTEWEKILSSFPNLERLCLYHKIRGEDYGPFLDLTRDRHGSMLRYHGGMDDDADVAGLIAVLPDLLIFDYYNMAEECFKALAQHCPKLMYVRADWEGESVFINEDDYDELPPSTVNLLLTSCPNLVSVNCPDAPLHIRHILDGPPWVCSKLKFLRCEMLGIPWIDWSYELYESMMARLPEVLAPDGSLSSIEQFSEQEQEMLRTVALREQCRRGLQAQLSRVPHLKFDPSCECLGDYMHEKGYFNYLRINEEKKKSK
ncbi:hypothetical protein BGW42_003500 [Actinomortierella wolfii]|nr:hypothetical protein BGW42_003500 [Actinomortierella wolfii]